MKDKLVLGSGSNYLGSDYVHLDILDLAHIDVQHDLSTGKLPFKDNRFNKVEAHHVLEHLPQEAFHDIMEEINRVCKPEAEVVITLPYYLSVHNQAADHYRSGSEITFNVFTDNHSHVSHQSGLYTNLEYRYGWNQRKYVKLLKTVLPNGVVSNIPDTVHEITYYLEVKKRNE